MIFIDQERLRAYQNLIEELLSCEKGQEQDILKANQDLIDEELIQILLSEADKASGQGNEFVANLMLSIAMHIG